MKLTKTYRFGLTLVSFLLICSCSIRKYLPQEENLYTGADITIESDTVVNYKDELILDLKSVLRPKPNSSFLGMYPGLYFYYKNQKENPGFINRWLYKQIGEKPVYQSDIELFETEKILLNRLENKGFFYSRVVSDVILNEEDNEASVHYTATVAHPYTLASYQLDSFPPPLNTPMKSLLANTKFFKGMRFDLSNFKIERERIDGELKKKGYYNFNPNFLIFETDTNQYNNRKFDLYLKLKSNVPQKSIKPYKIAAIDIYADYDLDSDINLTEGTDYNNKTYIQDSDPIFFKPKYLDPFILLKKGQYYNPDISKNTSRRLSSIGAYKFVNIQYEEVDSLATDSLGILRAKIQLSPLNKRAFKAELQAVTKSNNFTGPAIALTYTNRNLFYGGEILNLTASAGYEKQFGGGKDVLGASSLQLGLSTELIFPRMIFPIKIKSDFFEYSIPKTIGSIGFDFVNRTDLYQIFSANARFGYFWKANRFVTHEINPLSLIFTKLSNTTEEFETILEENTFLARSFEQQFIPSLNYTFTYNGMVDNQKTHNFFANTSFEIAGNVVGLFGKETEQGSPKELFGQEYAQFAKADIDLRYHFNFSNDQTIATRLFAGYGLAYGNSDQIPYIKQYFAGGPYSVRAFRIRSLGPGTYGGEDVDLDLDGEPDNIGFFDQTGNIRLEANVEYRFPIFGFLKGAVFVDAGNIWNSDANPFFNGTDEFSGEFLSELGMGTGIGVRIDLQGFVIRFDLAAPFHDPALPKGERFNFDLENPVLNFAIGYPF